MGSHWTSISLSSLPLLDVDLTREDDPAHAACVSLSGGPYACEYLQLVRFTYRSGMRQPFASDAGWGCMVRCAQVVTPSFPNII